jgi:hypothetical protein
MLRRSRARRPLTHRLVIVPFLFCAVLVAVFGYCAPHADAATAKPVTACGSTVTWTVEFESLAPAGARGAVAWAYGQVAPVARLQAKNTDTGKVRWSWPDPMSGVSAETADTWEESLSNGRYRLHSHRIEGETSTATLRTQALRDVLRDLGVASPLSTVGGLSARDRQALRRTCAAQGVAGKTKAGSKPAAAPVSTDVDTDKAEPKRRVEPVPMVAPWLTGIATLVALVLLVSAGIYVVRPSLCTRFIALVRAGRGRVGVARKPRQMRVPADTTHNDEGGEQ